MASYKDHIDEVPSYIVKVKRYATWLIEQQIWDSISHDDLDKWINNFKDPEDKLLAGLLLENLIYRSADQTKSLLFNAINTCIPKAIYESPTSILSNTSFSKVLTSRSIDKSLRIIPVIRNSDPPTKSGPAVARLYRRHIKVNEKYMTWPWLITGDYNNGARIFIFIDDTLASGNQFSSFINETIQDPREDAKYIYIPMLAHKNGIKVIRDSYPFIRTCPVEIIDDSLCFFAQEKCKIISDIKDLYLSVSKKYLKASFYDGMALGYEDLSLCFSFYHSTPNASLPLYWYEDDEFYPLLKR